MGTRLKTIEGHRGEIIRKRVEELFNKANTAIDCFSSPVREGELKEVEALFEQARLELKELSGNNDGTNRAGLLSKFNELKKKLEPYKVEISDRQQTTATNSEVNNKIDPQLDDYLKQYERKHKDLQGQVQKYSIQYPGEHRMGKICDLRDFYLKSLETAKELKLEKFAGIPAYNKECLILNNHIDTIRMHLEALNKQLQQLHQEQRNEAKRSDCMQS